MSWPQRNREPLAQCQQLISLGQPTTAEPYLQHTNTHAVQKPSSPPRTIRHSHPPQPPSPPHRTSQPALNVNNDLLEAFSAPATPLQQEYVDLSVVVANLSFCYIPGVCADSFKYVRGKLQAQGCRHLRSRRII